VNFNLFNSTALTKNHVETFRRYWSTTNLKNLLSIDHNLAVSKYKVLPFSRLLPVQLFSYIQTKTTKQLNSFLMFCLKGVFSVQAASAGLNVLDLTTSINRHWFINNFIIFKTPTFGKRQSVIQESLILTSQSSISYSVCEFLKPWKLMSRLQLNSHFVSTRTNSDVWKPIALTLYRAIVYSIPLLQDNTIPSCQLRLHRSSPYSTQQKSSAVFFVHSAVNSKKAFKPNMSRKPKGDLKPSCQQVSKKLE
jgi:hypothetical protein